MSYYFIGVWSLWRGFNWNVVALVRLNGFFIDVCTPCVTTVSHANLLESDITTVELIPNFDGWFKRNGHVGSLKRSVGFKYKNKAIRKLLADLNSKCPVRASWGLDSSTNIRLWVDVFEDNSSPEANLFLHMTA